MAKCHACGVEEGQLHQLGCDMERCPFCGGQLISCNCPYEKLGIDNRPGTYAYERGLSTLQMIDWENKLKRKGRIPWVDVPITCALCGKTWPRMFMVPNEEWQKHVPPNLQREVLCGECYSHMKQLFPKGWRKSKS